MKHKWVRGALVAVLAAVLLSAGSFVVDRVWLAVFDQRIYEFLRPTEADVLDGRVANEERIAALGDMSELSGELNVNGVARVGEVVWTVCSMGRNTYKVHDGYRLSCDARVVSYLAWSGSYENAAAALRARIISKCPDLQLDPGPRPPTPGAPTTVATYGCADRTKVRVHFESTDRLAISDSVLSVGMTSSSSRRISGSSPEELFNALSEYQWFAVVSASQTYYKDQP